ncbi:MAG TPA: translation initiation factor IF-2 N-terminal domain-containing protein, partial [Candidatus Avacidaminococcus intestinavium]|nr:translation initiation factor IF-2 N-terminal domain-containing protein [Candidatus Avacidaminococcus intestinavium]
MVKYRVFEVAKEYNTSSKVILDILNRNNIEVKNHMSSIDENVKKIISRTF